MKIRKYIRVSTYCFIIKKKRKKKKKRRKKEKNAAIERLDKKQNDKNLKN